MRCLPAKTLMLWALCVMPDDGMESRRASLRQPSLTLPYFPLLRNEQQVFIVAAAPHSVKDTFGFFCDVNFLLVFFDLMC